MMREENHKIRKKSQSSTDWLMRGARARVSGKKVMQLRKKKKEFPYETLVLVKAMKV